MNKRKILSSILALSLLFTSAFSANAASNTQKTFTVQRVPFSITDKPVIIPFNVSKENSCWRVWANNYSNNNLDLIICDENGEVVNSQTIVGKNQFIIQGFYDGNKEEVTYKMILFSKDYQQINGLYSWRIGQDFGDMNNSNQTVNPSVSDENKFFISTNQYLAINIPSSKKYTKISVQCDYGYLIKAKITDEQDKIVDGGDIKTIAKGDSYSFYITRQDNYTGNYKLYIAGVNSYSASGSYYSAQSDIWNTIIK